MAKLGKLTELLKYKAEVTLKDKNSEDLAKVWVRLLGDEDLKEAFKFSRIASNKKRVSLSNPESSDRQDTVAQLAEQPLADLIDIIVAARENEFGAEAAVTVDREDLPEIASVAKRPDAPTLVEQEKLDQLIEEQEAAYQKALEEYIQTRITELRAEMTEKPFDEVVELASESLINIEALQRFLEELNDQKIFRGTFSDKDCTERAFENIEEAKDAHPLIKTQLLEAYNALEISGDDIKN